MHASCHGPLRIASFVSAFLILIILAAVAAAQVAAPAPSTGQSPAPAAQATDDKNAPEMSSRDVTATFKVRVNLVLVRAVVRDKQGRAIGDLRQQDFELLDDRRPQTITRFSVEAFAPPAARPGAKTVATAETVPAIGERYVAYVFDDVHTDVGSLMRARVAADRHIASSLTPTDRAAIFTISGRGNLDFTDDRAKLHQALQQLRPNTIVAYESTECPYMTYYLADLIINKSDQRALQIVTNQVMDCNGIQGTRTTQKSGQSEVVTNRADLQMARELAESEARRALEAGRNDTQVSLTVLRDIVKRMGSLPGQRSVLLASPGFFLADQYLDVEDVIDRARRSNVAINALDPRGLYTDTSLKADQGGHAYGMEDAKIREYQRDNDRIQTDVLTVLADGTGGSFLKNSNDLDAGFKRLAAAPEFVYTLGFTPQNLKLDGKFHPLTVRLKTGQNYTIVARRGYYAPRRLTDPVEAARQEIEEALFSEGELQDIPLDVNTDFFKPGAGGAKLAVLAHVDLKRLVFRKTAGRNCNTLTVVYGLFDRNGRFLSGTEKIVELRLRDETLQEKLGTGIVIRSNFDVQPGDYLVRVVVRDTEGQLLSTKNGVVQIP